MTSEWKFTFKKDKGTEKKKNSALRGKQNESI